MVASERRMYGVAAFSGTIHTQLSDGWQLKSREMGGKIFRREDAPQTSPDTTT